MCNLVRDNSAFFIEIMSTSAAIESSSNTLPLQSMVKSNDTPSNKSLGGQSLHYLASLGRHFDFS